MSLASVLLGELSACAPFIVIGLIADRALEAGSVVQSLAVFSVAGMRWHRVSIRDGEGLARGGTVATVPKGSRN